MNKAEFIKSASRSGYCTQQQAGEYCRNHPKDEYTEDDYVDVCRYSNKQYFKQRDNSFSLSGNGRSTKRYYRYGGTESDRL